QEHDEDDDYPVQRRFDDSEPQPVYDVGYGEDEYGEVYDVYDVYDVEDMEGDVMRPKRSNALADEEDTEDTGSRKNPFADDVGVAGGKNPAFQAPSRKNPFADDDEDEDDAPAADEKPAAQDEVPSLEDGVKRPSVPSKANPFEDAEED